MTVDLTAARARVMARCARRGHDWTWDEHGQRCTRCRMVITDPAQKGQS